MGQLFCDTFCLTLRFIHQNKKEKKSLFKAKHQVTVAAFTSIPSSTLFKKEMQYLSCISKIKVAFPVEEGGIPLQ